MVVIRNIIQRNILAEPVNDSDSSNDSDDEVIDEEINRDRLQLQEKKMGNVMILSKIGAGMFFLIILIFISSGIIYVIIAPTTANKTCQAYQYVQRVKLVIVGSIIGLYIMSVCIFILFSVLYFIFENLSCVRWIRDQIEEQQITGDNILEILPFKILIFILRWSSFGLIVAVIVYYIFLLISNIKFIGSECREIWQSLMIFDLLFIICFFTFYYLYILSYSSIMHKIQHDGRFRLRVSQRPRYQRVNGVRVIIELI